MFSHISNKDLPLEDSLLIVYFSEVLLQMVVILWFIPLMSYICKRKLPNLVLKDIYPHIL